MTEKNISEITNLKELNVLNDEFKAQAKSIDSELNDIKKSIVASDEKGIETLKEHKKSLVQKKSILDRKMKEASEKINSIYDQNKSLKEYSQKSYMGSGDKMTEINIKKSLDGSDLEKLNKNEKAFTNAILPIKKALTAENLPINITPSANAGLFETHQQTNNILQYLPIHLTNTNATRTLIDLTDVYDVAKGFIEDGTKTKKTSDYSIFDKTVYSDAIYVMKPVQNRLLTDSDPAVQSALSSLTMHSADSIISKLNVLPLVGDSATDPDDAITSVESIIGSENIFLDDAKKVPAGVKLSGNGDLIEDLANAKSIITKYSKDSNLLLVFSPKAFNKLRTLTNAAGSYVFPDNSVPLETQVANRSGLSDAKIVMSTELDDKATFELLNVDGYLYNINSNTGDASKTGNATTQATEEGISVPIMWDVFIEKNKTNLRAEVYASGTFVKGYSAVYSNSAITSVDKINVNDVTPKTTTPAADGSNDSGTGK